MIRRSACLLLVVGLAAACDLEFVAVGEHPRTDVTGASSHADQLTVAVELRHTDVEDLPTVVVAGDTVPGEWLGPAFGVHSTQATVDPADPYLSVRVLRPGETWDVSIPLLVREGAARTVEGGEVEIPVGFAPGPGSWSAHGWAVEVLDSDEDRLLLIQGEGALPDPLRLTASLLPPEAAVALVIALRAEAHAGVDIRMIGAATVDLPTDP